MSPCRHRPQPCLRKNPHAWPLPLEPGIRHVFRTDFVWFSRGGQGAAAGCRETPVCRTLKKLGDVRSLQGRYDSASDGLLGSLVIADVPISCFVRHFAVPLFQEVLYVINDASDSPFGSPY